MFLPQDTARQKITDLNISVSGCENYSITNDSFNNKKLYGLIKEPHNNFKVSISVTAESGIGIFDEYFDDPYRFLILKAQTDLTRPGEKLNEYRKSLHLNEFYAPYDKSLHIMRSLHDTFQYNSGITEVHETAENAFTLGKGVCQDYTHIMLSILRSEGIPARYVVGMMLGEGSSHAWVEALCRGYWYGFDPTNNKLVNDEYIRVSCGRDSSDCSVIKGSFYGFTQQDQKEAVNVEEIIAKD